jgi:hypothetical protein
VDGIAQGVETSVAWLEVIGGPAKGQRIPVQDEIRFGSQEVGEACLNNDRWLSPTHALIRHGEHGWTIEDLRSVEGTRVNGRPVRGATVLQEGDAIEIGSSRLVMVPPGGSTKPPGADFSEADLRPVQNKRWGAWLIDRLVLAPVAYFIGEMAEGRAGVALVYFALMLSYHFLCEALTGQTLGKALVGLRVVDMRGRPLRPSVVAARALLLLIDSALIGPITMIASGQRRRRLGDLAAGTVVVPADAPFVPSRRQRDRLTMWFYPLAWLAPCVFLLLFVPWASAPPCNEANMRGEGLCRAGNQVLDVRPAGHAVHLDGFDANLLSTRSTERRDGGRLVSFRLELTNTGPDTLRVPSRVAVTLGVIDDYGELRELPPSGSSDLRKLAPGKSGRVWVRYAVPAMAVQRLADAPTHLGIGDLEEPDGVVGWISLWRWAGANGMHAVAGLNK